MEVLLAILGIFFGLFTNAIAYGCFRQFLIKAEVNLENRVSKKCMTDKVVFENLKTEVKTHLDKITREIKLLKHEVDRLKNWCGADFGTDKLDNIIRVDKVN